MQKNNRRKYILFFSILVRNVDGFLNLLKTIQSLKNLPKRNTIKKRIKFSLGRCVFETFSIRNRNHGKKIRPIAETPISPSIRSESITETKNEQTFYNQIKK